MGINQSIEKNVPEEFSEHTDEKNHPKIMHYHKPKMHNFHGDYYQNEINESSPSSRRPSRMESQPFGLKPKTPIYSANASTYDLVEDQKARDELSIKKNYSNLLNVNMIGSTIKSQASFSEYEVLSLNSFNSPNIRKVMLDKHAQSLVKRSYFWETLPLQASYKILEYCIGDLSLMLQVHNSWKQRIKSILYFKSSLMATQFNNKFYKQLTMIDHQIVLKKMTIQKSGKAKMICHRLDILITCKVEKTLSAKSINLSYKYTMNNKGKQELYSNHLFDVCKEDATKVLWFYTEQRKVGHPNADKPEGRRVPVQTPHDGQTARDRGNPRESVEPRRSDQDRFDRVAAAGPAADAGDTGQPKARLPG